MLAKSLAAKRHRDPSRKDAGPWLSHHVDDDYVYKVVDALEAVAQEKGKSIPQVALNRVLGRPTVSSVIVGARNEEQPRQNLGAVGWAVTAAQINTRDDASARPVPYPYWHQAQFAERNPPPV